MKLSALIDINANSVDPEVTGITEDSRQVKSGYVFAALSGLRHNGALFIEDAVNAGASAILVNEDQELPNIKDEVALIKVSEPRRSLALMAARFYDMQPDYIAAVTGTNGKTSIADFLRQIWKLKGHDAVSIGTLGIRADEKVKRNSPLSRMSMTTPDPVSLQAGLADLKAAGFEHLAMEASSHGLDQCRLDGVKVRVAGFSNLSHDHLDYHATMDEYLAAKLRLFTDVLEDGGIAVINADVPEFDEIVDVCKDAGKRVISYGKNGFDIKVVNCTPVLEGQKLQINIQGQEYEFTLPLVGYFQVLNSLCALGLALAMDQGTEFENAKAYVSLLEKLKGVPGRLEYIDGHPNAAVYVDYAHTPDALSNILDALRPHTEGKLHCIIGCGGDRDRFKRPIMASISADKADVTIISDDNPRSEDPALIRKDMLEGAPDALEIDGRAKAIQKVISELQAGDVLVIAGKGHEQGQIIGNVTEPFDDREQARSAINALPHTNEHIINSGEALS